jgi:uncharacterized membrane protein
MKALAGVLSTLAVLATGGMAGIFFAFSVAVMPGLDAAKATAAIASMQSINQKIQNPLFLLTFVGAPLFGVLAGGVLLAVGERRAALLFFAAAAVYVLGSFLPTAVVNVPMNNALDATRIPSDLAEAAGVWAGYSPRWTAWNHLRTAACSISLLVMALGLYLWGKNGS